VRVRRVLSIPAVVATLVPAHDLLANGMIWQPFTQKLHSSEGAGE
jgi:hypothetical protein